MLTSHIRLKLLILLFFSTLILILILMIKFKTGLYNSELILQPTTLNLMLTAILFTIVQYRFNLMKFVCFREAKEEILEAFPLQCLLSF